MLTLADLDDEFATTAAVLKLSPAQLAALPAPWLPSGFHTLEFPDGSHRTFRVRLDRQGIHRGKRTLALLIGPDNSGDYETQATVESDGFKFFKRFANTRTVTQAAILWDIAKGETIDGYELLTEKRCRLCLRPLTDPESIRTELGPTCRGKARQ